MKIFKIKVQRLTKCRTNAVQVNKMEMFCDEEFGKFFSGLKNWEYDQASHAWDWEQTLNTTVENLTKVSEFLFSPLK